MSKLTGMRKVTPVQGELLTYRVESWTEKDEDHKVELLAHKGAGECDCDHWYFRIRKLIEKRDPRSLDLECSHLRAAKRYLVLSIIREGLRHENV